MPLKKLDTLSIAGCKLSWKKSPTLLAILPTKSNAGSSVSVTASDTLLNALTTFTPTIVANGSNASYTPFIITVIHLKGVSTSSTASANSPSPYPTTLITGESTAERKSTIGISIAFNTLSAGASIFLLISAISSNAFIIDCIIPLDANKFVNSIEISFTRLPNASIPDVAPSLTLICFSCSFAAFLIASTCKLLALTMPI